jgi:hypothetical protein
LFSFFLLVGLDHESLPTNEKKGKQTIPVARRKRELIGSRPKTRKERRMGNPMMYDFNMISHCLSSSFVPGRARLSSTITIKSQKKSAPTAQAFLLKGFNL